MTLVTLFTLVNVALDKLQTLAIDQNLTMTLIELTGSKIVIEFTPNLSANQRTILQTMLDAVGDGTISTP